MAILKQAKNIVVNVKSDSMIIANKSISKTAQKIMLRTTKGDIDLYSVKKINIHTDGN